MLPPKDDVSMCPWKEPRGADSVALRQSASFCGRIGRIGFEGASVRRAAGKAPPPAAITLTSSRRAARRCLPFTGDVGLSASRSDSLTRSYGPGGRDLERLAET